ncbi:BON domain-containing protein [Noviherbaspirillum sp. CPCC 100848]|uniref:BON domain-containing protein n=1 Tax=Noviherbaspirillum album TaxID=3080276 RepID=A0ABU6JHN6_9BURK|nr:BON domain-containing protein [Noviherbaspirillum sp. CPCC 100848]MEC4723161.1 BON domain-containing protein [Noviherbaspirillum sp. CPCC 100848]
MSKANIAAAALLATILSACSATPDSRATGQALDDTAITARVKTNIAKSQGFSEAATINVDTYRGVVLLAGFVDSKQQIDTAVAAASAVPGVDKVVNSLRLKSAP